MNSCGKGSGSSSEYASVTPRLANSITDLTSYLGQRAAAGDYAHSSVDGLTSLQYFITRINLCEDLTVSGSGYSGSKGCVTVYSAGNGENAYDTYKIVDASTDTTNYIDVMSGTSIAAATGKAVDIAPSTYKYGIIEHRKPIKLNANITLPNGSVILKTCSGGTVTSTGSDTSLRENTVVSSMTSCTQALISLGGGGGGQWFKFQNPIPFEKGKSYDLDLAFNPRGVLAAQVNSGGGTFYSDGSYMMIAPSLSLVPIVREASTQKTYREQYEISSMSGVNGLILVDMYFAGSKSDVGSGTIQGASTRFINSSTATSHVTLYNPYGVTVSGGTVSFQNYEGVSYLSGLTRATSETAVSAGTATVDKSGIYFPEQGSGTVTGTVTFNGLKQM